jgi:hypothetical protein
MSCGSAKALAGVEAEIAIFSSFVGDHSSLARYNFHIFQH